MKDDEVELPGEFAGEPRVSVLPFWSRDKLALLGQYLAAYVRIMTSPQQRKWLRRFSYIDAFSNAGQYGDEEAGTLVQGSPLVALDCEPPFDQYWFIERSEPR